MDREQEEMQFIGFFGIFIESYKIISSWRKIFTQITLSLILPLTFIFLAQIEVSDRLFWKIMRNEDQLEETKVGTPKYEKLSDVLRSEVAFFWLFKILYITFFLIFSLLSTAAVVYTIACIYTGREVTFKKVMSVVPKVWKRLMVTFLVIYVFVFAYHVVSFLLFVAVFVLIGYTSYSLLVLVIMLVLYFAGIVYMSVLWQLASVVSVLEDSFGIKAISKARSLIKGKMFLAVRTFFLLNLCYVVILFVFKHWVVHGFSVGTLNRVCFGISSFLFLLAFFLFGLVIQTVIYFVCKSFHHENIDKSALSDHLEVYLGEYVPLKSKDVQLEQYGIV